MVKKALCVGLNYPNYRQHQLYGCINDALNWEHELKNSFQFDETRVLIDQHPDGTLATAPTQIPTRDNILAQLSWLCDCQPGDCLAFIFAGHGCQVRNSIGEIDQALVPEDFATAPPDPHGAPPLVFADEVQAVFQRIPTGAMITVIIDACHGSSILDVPCWLDTSERPPKHMPSCERPGDIAYRTPQAWEKMMIPLCYARPRFMPTVVANGPPRQRRTPPGSGAFVNRMTLDPGVTAFCFAAGRPAETALDANIKAHQQGVMSFCLREALRLLQNRCTYEQLIEKAAAVLDDVREKYIPEMDQYIHFSFSPHSHPSEVVVLDPRYATSAQYKLQQRGLEAMHGVRGEPPLAAPQHPPQQRLAGREASIDFVPSPNYGGPHGPLKSQYGGPGHVHAPSNVPPPPAKASSPAGAHDGKATATPAAYLYVRVCAAHNLKNTDSGLFGDVSDPYVFVKVGKQEKKTPTKNNNLNPVWTEDHNFAFSLREKDQMLELNVMNSNFQRDDCIGKCNIDLRRLRGGEWIHLREQLQSGQGDVEFDVRIERLTPPQPDPHMLRPPVHAPMQQQQQRSLQLERPPSPGRPQQPNGNALHGAGLLMPGAPSMFGPVPNLLGEVLNQPGGAPAAMPMHGSGLPALSPMTSDLTGIGSQPYAPQPYAAPQLLGPITAVPTAVVSPGFQAVAPVIPMANAFSPALSTAMMPQGMPLQFR
eukprot:TRINITY_DN58681_c0_g1_i1.p1 TRINITY_DN58681_c0_g1~~TRINITY_DN58681_c0_g1_i1.p1  ORF type:complete len:706 (+),score=94.94 TRINITY_DN58681_c0_g1_i1:88-2205(+)